MPHIDSDAQYIIYASLSVLAILIWFAARGAMLYIVGRSLIDYSYATAAEYQKELLASFDETDELDEHFAQSPVNVLNFHQNA